VTTGKSMSHASDAGVCSLFSTGTVGLSRNK